MFGIAYFCALMVQLIANYGVLQSLWERNTKRPPLNREGLFVYD